METGCLLHPGDPQETPSSSCPGESTDPGREAVMLSIVPLPSDRFLL